ncbi:MAG: hypothetical protein M1839_004589 [Geoglossum umbratile]|nr:MAG: hypothetical protein M1839_004589 [Geoglossum umbratile]
MERNQYPENIDQLREREYPGLREIQDTTYLDHAGTTVYAKSLIDQFAQDMKANLFGNPHSRSPSSELSTRRVDSARLRVLQFFKASPDDFDVIFVANATAGIKMVMDAFVQHESSITVPAGGPPRPFWYGYHRDSHTSLVGVRELALGRSRCFETDQQVEDWIAGRLKTGLDQCGESEAQLGLFAYPAQSNMNGRRLPLSWPAQLRESSKPGHKNVYTLLDAAAYVCTAQLDLSDAKAAPDFTTLSFYKIFGFPDLGALIVRKDSGHILEQRRYFGGGTVDMVICMKDDWHAKKTGRLHEKMEDGTLPFHNIIALDSALDVHERLYGSMDRISQYTCYLSKQLYDGLSSLRHANGMPVCVIYRDPASQYGNSKTQGPTIAFNLQNNSGGWIGKSDVERLANLHGIQLRTGGVCNPGGIASSLSLESWELRRNFMEGMKCGDDLDIMGGKPTGIVRVSLGAMTTRSDVLAFLRFVSANFTDNRHNSVGCITPGLSLEPLPSRRIESLRIAPVAGCALWEIPEGAAWEVRSTGLVWDREWCLVCPRTGALMSATEYPGMRKLRPSVHWQEGVLRVRSSPKGCEETELVVSLWEIPLPEGHIMPIQSPHTLNKPIVALPYTSKAISDFFTFAIGAPCTLARFPISPSPQAAKVLANRAIIAPSTGSIVVAIRPNFRKNMGSDSPDANIIVSSLEEISPKRDDWLYMRIGEQFFHILGRDEATQISEPLGPALIPLTTINQCNLLSSASPSPASQNPTISLHDPVRLFTSSSHPPLSYLDSLTNPTTPKPQHPMPWCEEMVGDFEGCLASHTQTSKSDVESLVTKDEKLVSTNKGKRKKRGIWLARATAWLRSPWCSPRYQPSR